MIEIRLKESDSLEGRYVNCRGCKGLAKGKILLKGWVENSSISDMAEMPKTKIFILFSATSCQQTT